MSGSADLHRSTFANGEIYVRPTESVRGADCFVMQSHSHPDQRQHHGAVDHHRCPEPGLGPADHRGHALLRLLAAGQEGSAAGADHRPSGGQLLHAAGADRLVSVDLHTGQLQGFVHLPFDHLTALPIITDYLRERIDGPTAVISPDAGGVKRAERYARRLDATVAFVYKRREPEHHNASAALEVSGEVAGRHAIIVDDMIDTAGTVCQRRRTGGCPGCPIGSDRRHPRHPLRAGGRPDQELSVEEVIVTNTLPVSTDAAQLDKVKVLSIASIVAEALHAIFTESSVSEIFLGDNT